jgi:hypothetical protein
MLGIMPDVLRVIVSGQESRLTHAAATIGARCAEHILVRSDLPDDCPAVNWPDGVARYPEHCPVYLEAVEQAERARQVAQQLLDPGRVDN